MVKIISMSLGEDLLAEIEDAKNVIGYSGRSEVIRAGVKLLIDYIKEKEKLKGHAECILIFVHDKKFEDAFIKTKNLDAFSQRWRPYRSYASLYLWKSLEKKPSKVKW